MANPEHVEIVRQGNEAIQKWRERNPGERLDLSEVDLSNADLSGVDLADACFIGVRLRGATLCEADLSYADLSGADLTDADLTDVRLRGADLSRVNLRNATLIRADLSAAGLSGADLIGADLNEVNLTGTDLLQSVLIRTNLEAARLKDCRIYGISAWDLHGTPAEQANLIIAPYDQPEITVDDLEVAQFVYLLLNNPKVRRVIDTITTKVVLILGRFTPERKAVLDAIREELRKRNYVPILFDFEKSDNRDFIETVSTLAHMARFVIADVTDAGVVLQELQRIVPALPSVPVQPLLLQGADPTIVLTDFLCYPWFLPPHLYADQPELLASLAEKVITPAEEKANAVKEQLQKAQAMIQGLRSSG